MYFNPNKTYRNAIVNKDVGALRALLIGIIGADPTFATTEYEEAKRYIKKKSLELNGEELHLEEEFVHQEDEYEKDTDEWNETYFQMQLLWFRYNFAEKDRLKEIRKIGRKVYENKSTLGKSKKQSLDNQRAVAVRTNNIEKKDEVAMATGSDNKIIRLVKRILSVIFRILFILFILFVFIKIFGGLFFQLP